jgi:uncharacterized protein (DUF305 family)
MRCGSAKSNFKHPTRKTIMKIIALAALVLSLGTSAALAQDSSLPDICKATPVMNMDTGADGMEAPMDDAHKALMAGMAAMNKDMDQGMTAKDIDVAFVCGMIPHHQGAIDMAKAELQYGDDPWVKEMAQKVIDAQTKEIADMKDWLSKQK